MIFHSVHYSNAVDAWVGSHVGIFIMFDLIVTSIFTFYVTRKLAIAMDSLSRKIFNSPVSSIKAYVIFAIVLEIILLWLSYKLFT